MIPAMTHLVALLWIFTPALMGSCNKFGSSQQAAE
jgi:hypothetical protein